MKLSTILFLLIGGLLLSSCREETIEPEVFGSLAGYVVSSPEDSDVVGARVSTNPPTSTVLTDSIGQFVIDQLPTGNYTVRVEQEGFTSSVENVKIYQDQTANIIVSLEPDSLSNSAPGAPTNPSPALGTTVIGTSQTLHWTTIDPDEDDQLSYDVYLYGADQVDPELVASNITEDSLKVSNLDYDRVYFWQIVARDQLTNTNGPVWNFRTAPFPDNRYLYARESDGNFQIFANNLDGNEFQLTMGGGSSWRPRMGPLRNRIAFLGTDGLETYLYRMNRDGSGRMKLSTNPVRGFSPSQLDFAWSPDGSKLYFMDNEELYSVRSDGTDLTLVATAPTGFTFSEVDVNPAGTRMIARLTGDDFYESFIVLMDLEGNYLEYVVPDTFGATLGGAFSLDGNWLLYTHDVSGNQTPNERQLDTRIFLQNLTDLSQPPLDISDHKPPGTLDLDARFSPDGAYIIFVNTNNDGISPKNIYRMDLQGDSRTLLFSDAVMPDWR